MYHAGKSNHTLVQSVLDRKVFSLIAEGGWATREVKRQERGTVVLGKGVLGPMTVRRKVTGTPGGPRAFQVQVQVVALCERCRHSEERRLRRLTRTGVC